MFDLGDTVLMKGHSWEVEVTDLDPMRPRLRQVSWQGENGTVSKWLPAEELQAVAKQAMVPEAKLTGWGRTTPEYLVKLRKEQWVARKREAGPKPKKVFRGWMTVAGKKVHVGPAKRRHVPRKDSLREIAERKVYIPAQDERAGADRA